MDNKLITRKEDNEDAKLQAQLKIKDLELLETAKATHARLSQGYNDKEAQRDGEKVKAHKALREELASQFVEIEDMENLLKAKITEPAAFEKLVVGSKRIAVGHYELAKSAAKRTGQFSKEAIQALEDQNILEKALDQLKATSKGE